VGDVPDNGGGKSEKAQMTREVTGRYLLRVLGWLIAGALYVRWLVWRAW